MEKFEFYDHTADAKFRSYGKTLEESFINAAYAMYSIIIDPQVQKKLEEKIAKNIIVEGKDYESLLYNFLEEFIVLLDAEFFLLKKIANIKISMKHSKYVLICNAIGDSNDDYETEKHVKAVTYNEMFVKKENNLWVCQVVLDL